MATGDFDNDGITDFAAVNFLSNTVSISLGSTFSANPVLPAFQTYATGLNPTAIAALDYNGDGNTDLAVGFQNDTTIQILLGDGHGNFSQSTPLHGPVPGISAILTADIDLDGKPDLILATAQGVAILFNGSTNLLLTSISGIASIALGDIVHQGIERPLIAVTTDSTLMVLRYGGTYITQTSIPLGAGPHPLAFEDVNGDGRRDILVGTSGGILAFPGDGLGGLSVPTTIGVPEPPTYIAVTDLDGDGFPDLAATFPNGGSAAGLQIYRGSSGGGFGPPRRTPFEIYYVPGALTAGTRQIGQQIFHYLLVAFPNASTITLFRACLDPQTLTATFSPLPTVSGWYNTDVTVSLQAILQPGGFPVGHIIYAFSGSQSGSGAHVSSSIVFHEGTSELSWYARNSAGNSEMPKSLTVTIRTDHTPPVISGMPGPGCTLWPPNHQLVPVANISAQDAISGLAGLTVSATSNEPDNGTGDGDTSPDVVISGGQLQLRAERSNSGNGRFYAITATATDLAGNTATATASCTVAK